VATTEKVGFLASQLPFEAYLTSPKSLIVLSEVQQRICVDLSRRVVKPKDARLSIPGERKSASTDIISCLGSGSLPAFFIGMISDSTHVLVTRNGKVDSL